MLDFYSPLSAMNAYGTVVQASAHNVANMNTEGFKAVNAHLSSGPENRGVVVASVTRDMSPGPMYHNGYERIEGSNTDLPREFVNMISTGHAYGAQAALIRALDEMTGSILNVRT